MNEGRSAKEMWAERSNTPLREVFARTPSLDWDGPTSEVYPFAEVQSVDLTDADGAFERLLDETDELPPSEAARRLAAFDRRLVEECSDHANRNSVMVRRGVRRRAATSSESVRMAGLVAGHHQRALGRGLPSTLTQDEWTAILESHRGTCGYCGTQDAKLTMDHVIALSAGGSNTAENVVACCGFCNISKSGRDLLEWLDGRGLDADAAFQRIHEARARRGVR